MVHEIRVPYDMQEALGYNSVLQTLHSPAANEDHLDLLACTSPFKLIELSQSRFDLRLAGLRCLDINSTLLYLYRATGASSSAPKEGSLPQLTKLRVNLDHPNAESSRDTHEGRRPLQALDSFMGADPNHVTIELVQQMGAVAPKLRTILVHGNLDLRVIEKLALITQLVTLDFSDAEPVGQGSLENFRSLASMPDLQKLVLPKSLYTWSTATSAPIVPPALNSLRIPEGTVRRKSKDEDRLSYDGRASFLGHILPRSLDMGGGALIAFQNPHVTDLRVDYDHLVGISRMAKQIGQYHSLQHLHIELYKWDEGSSIGDVLANLVGIPGLKKIAFYYYAGRFPMFLPQLEFKDATVIWRAWPHLHSLSLGPVTFAFFEEILRLLPALTELEVGAFCWEEGEAEGKHCLPHLNMRSLIFGGRPDRWRNCMPNIVEYVAALLPNLQHMDIVVLNQRGPGEYEYDDLELPPAGSEPTYSLPRSKYRADDDKDIAEGVMRKVEEMRLVRVLSGTRPGGL